MPKILVIDSFYSTYEELKLLLQPRSKKGKNKFLQYLWGIETIMIWWFIHVVNLFLQYLWGIETMGHGWGRGGTETVFTVPMRNWNFFNLTFLRL